MHYGGFGIILWIIRIFIPDIKMWEQRRFGKNDSDNLQISVIRIRLMDHYIE